MQEKDFIYNNVYTVPSNDTLWIVRARGTQEGYILTKSVIRDKYFNTNSRWGKTCDFFPNARPATIDEINHLEACEKAGKYVSLPKKVENPIVHSYNLI